MKLRKKWRTSAGKGFPFSRSPSSCSPLPPLACSPMHSTHAHLRIPAYFTAASQQSSSRNVHLRVSLKYSYFIWTFSTVTVIINQCLRMTQCFVDGEKKKLTDEQANNARPVISLARASLSLILLPCPKIPSRENYALYLHSIVRRISGKPLVSLRDTHTHTHSSHKPIKNAPKRTKPSALSTENYFRWNVRACIALEMVQRLKC